jgi:protein-tyrosine phosphatase
VTGSYEFKRHEWKEPFDLSDIPKGHWALVTEKTFELQNGVMLCCPECGLVAGLPHEIDWQGNVTPSIVCPYTPPCTMHLAPVKLLGWNYPTRRKGAPVGPIIEEICPGIIQANADGALVAYRERVARNIGGFVNVAHDIEQEYPEAESLRLRLNDDIAASPEDIDRAVAFQKRISSTNRKTLVHCRAAMNRSSMIVAAMMVAWGATVDEALARLPRKPYSAQMNDSLRRWAPIRKA